MFRAFKVYFTHIDTPMSPSRIPGIDYSLNPYIGCIHGCLYCYARLYTRDKWISWNWGRVVVVKSNIVESLRRNIEKYRRGIVGVGTITDPYQPVEAVYRLTRRCIELLFEKDFYVSIQTKNPLVLRDLDLFIPNTNRVDIGFTITTLDHEISSSIEPNTPPPVARVNALMKLSNIGVKTWVFYGPVIPGLNDDDETIESIVNTARDTSSTLYYDPLRVRSFMLRREHPLYEYATRVDGKWWRSVVERVLKLCSINNVSCRPGFID